MLLGNDVLDVKRRESSVGLGESAILTPMPCALPDLQAGKELGKQLDVVEQLRKSVLPHFVGLCFRVNDQPLKGPKCLGNLFGREHGLPPKSKPTSSTSM
jgi:hypothetical protein